jgi:hypothetical protein
VGGKKQEGIETVTKRRAKVRQRLSNRKIHPPAVVENAHGYGLRAVDTLPVLDFIHQFCSCHPISSTYVPYMDSIHVQYNCRTIAEQSTAGGGELDELWLESCSACLCLHCPALPFLCSTIIPSATISPSLALVMCTYIRYTKPRTGIPAMQRYLRTRSAERGTI